ncbi:M20/M25/M40 family metallo-hydrolase [Halotalea alkalilenta]|uniref:M20/M25/M40 family metallo-hydrolase n=1 Tax=Halotalea alkalilenta TaxID=376489 RepID=UPI000A6EB55E|nr:M20/M25/M40 family metallo-hydrolase [Halotalea alkalilenta]
MNTAARLRAQVLELLDEWTPIHSVAGDREGLTRMARCLEEHLSTVLGATIVDEGRQAFPPVVHARIDLGAPVTLQLYNMYDVMPADESGWLLSPFRGGLDLDAPRPRYIGRGAENNKGPLAAMLVAVRHLLEQGGLGVNLELLIEGEEESGSRNLRNYLRGDTPVRPAEATLFPSLCEYAGGPPRVYYGFKGIAHGRVRVEGGAWGGPRQAIHSSNSPWIGNPCWELIEALAPLRDGALGEVALPASLVPVFDQLAAGFEPERELEFRHTERFSLQGDRTALLHRLLCAHQLNLSELTSHPLPGKATIPAVAEARFDLRVAPGAEIAQLLDRVEAAIRARPAAAIQLDECFPGIAFSPDAPGFPELIASYRAAGVEPLCWPWSPGAAPAHAFAKVSRAFVIGGLGRGGNAHGIDEYVELEGIDRLVASLTDWLARFPGASPSHRQS